MPDASGLRIKIRLLIYSTPPFARQASVLGPFAGFIDTRIYRQYTFFARRFIWIFLV